VHKFDFLRVSCAGTWKCREENFSCSLLLGKCSIDNRVTCLISPLNVECLQNLLSLSTLKQDGPITKNSSSSATTIKRPSNVKENQTQKPEAVVTKSRSERWKLTGVVALNDCDLKVSYSDLFESLL